MRLSEIWALGRPMVWIPVSSRRIRHRGHRRHPAAHPQKEAERMMSDSLPLIDKPRPSNSVCPCQRAIAVHLVKDNPGFNNKAELQSVPASLQEIALSQTRHHPE